MRKFENVLLGYTTEGCLVFADVDFRNHTFSASFSEVTPIVVTDGLLMERAESFVEDMDDAIKLQILERLDCKYSELVEEFFQVSKQEYGVEELIDISLYPESFSIDGIDDDIYFESVGCGQHDTRDTLIPINYGFSTKLHQLWDELHLKVVTEEKEMEICQMVYDYLDTFDENIWIRNWLEENIQ